jgi:chorismate dehydratase
MEEPKKKTPQRIWRLGVVSYLNSRPLIEGLEANRDVELLYQVPARLPTMLDNGEVDVALVPVVDLVRPDRNWRVVSDACIGCDGETLTVRVFSRVPPESIHRLHVDGDSHTSVALAKVIWREMYQTDLEITPFGGNETVDECEAVLFIGDKVVTNKLIDYDIQTDLGSAWKSLTSLPFVFAVWAGQKDTEVSDLARRLSQARDAGVRSAELIAADLGPGLGWPVALAKRYLTSRLKFTLGPRQKEAMERFLTLAGNHGIVHPQGSLVFA